MTRRALLERRLRRDADQDPILRAVREAAAQTAVPVWLVGGWVRDAALGRSPQDVDLSVGPRGTTLVRRLTETWRRRAFRFRKRGVTTWRLLVAGREVDIVEVGRRGIEQDLSRRELTFNAIAFDLREGTILDPLDGLRDLRAGLLRFPRPGVVREDPVRVLRLARFLAEFPGFRLDPSARREVETAAKALGRASVERVRDELDRILLAPVPSRGLESIRELGLLRAVLPEAVPLLSCPSGPARPDVWTHTLLALDRAARPRALPGSEWKRDREDERALRWSLLLHDIAKPRTLSRRPDGRITFHGHEVAGGRDAEATLRRFKISRELRRRVRRLVLLHLRPHHLADAGAPARGLRRLVRDAGEDLPLLLLHAGCDAKASGAPDGPARWRRLGPVLHQLLEIDRRSREFPVPRLVTGDDVMREVGIPPGPEVGRILREIRDLQEQGVLGSREDALRSLRKRARRD